MTSCDLFDLDDPRDPPVTIHIPINPVPASRPRVGKWGTYYGKNYTAFREAMKEWLVKYELTDTHRELKNSGCGLAVELGLEVKQPKSTKLAMPKPDVDNYAKAVLDSCNEFFWIDDWLIEDLTVNKRWAPKGEPGSIYLRIYESERTWLDSK